MITVCQSLINWSLSREYFGKRFSGCCRSLQACWSLTTLFPGSLILPPRETLGTRLHLRVTRESDEEKSDLAGWTRLAASPLDSAWTTTPPAPACTRRLPLPLWSEVVVVERLWIVKRKPLLVEVRYLKFLYIRCRFELYIISYHGTRVLCI